MDRKAQEEEGRELEIGRLFVSPSSIWAVWREGHTVASSTASLIYDVCTPIYDS